MDNYYNESSLLFDSIVQHSKVEFKLVPNEGSISFLDVLLE